jgi:hypothetical protein
MPSWTLKNLHSACVADATSFRSMSEEPPMFICMPLHCPAFGKFFSHIFSHHTESKLWLAKPHLSRCYCTSLISLNNHTWLEIKSCKIFQTGKTMLKNSGMEHTTFTHLLHLNRSTATSFSIKTSQLLFLQLYAFYTSEARFWGVKVRTSKSKKQRLSKKFYWTREKYLNADTESAV